MAWLTRGARLIESLGPDLVLNNGALPFATGARSCSLAHDLGWATAAPRFQRLRATYKRFAYGRADHVVALSSEVREGLATQLGILEAGILLIPPCIDLPAYHGGGFEDREDAILHTGTEAYKNRAATVRAFARLGDRGTRLYVEGPPQPALSTLVMDLPSGIRRRIELLGGLDAPRLRRLAGSVRVASFPTRYRVPTASATVVEAVATATPIAGSPSLSADVLQDGANGLVCRDDQELAAAYRSLLQDSTRWTQASQCARVLARSFSADRVADAYIDLAGREGQRTSNARRHPGSDGTPAAPSSDAASRERR